MTKKILLIDDEPDITFTVKNVLEDSGFKVDCFNHPIESCYWFATLLVKNKFNSTDRCYNCNKKDIHLGTILVSK